MSETVSEMLSAAAAIQRNRDMLLKALTDLGISEVTVHYEIYADAGDISQLVVFPESLQSCLDSTLLPYQTFVIVRDTEQGHVVLDTGQESQLSLRAALCDFAFSWVSFKYPDWDSDEGCDGKVILDTDEQRCELIHTQYDMAYVSHDSLSFT
jgi:hypothetical protein